MHSHLAVKQPRLEDFASGLVEEIGARLSLDEISLEEFLEGRSTPQSVSTLAALIKLDLQRRFDDGERPRVAEYLDRFPTLKEDNDKVVSLVYEEFCLLQEIGEDPDSREFSEAYAPWRDSILSQLVYHRDLSLAIGAQPAKLPFPNVGEQFDKYRLTKILGNGAVARVYLATEEDLGGRKLVIKVSGSFGQEPAILARLKHRNIVPILTVARSESGLGGICMPYRAGLTLDELIEKIGRGTPPPKARSIREVLHSVEADADVKLDDCRLGWETFPQNRSFADAVAWIGLALSDALEYLHSQKVFHRDIKPANILMTHEDGPQLLDFNLSQEPDTPERVSVSMKGGTLPYMAPEQLQAFLEVSGWKDVGCSADIYSLGLVLRELATGNPPELPDPKLSMIRAVQGLIVRRARPLVPAREINPLIPPSLDAIFNKCLKFDSSDRYLSAKALSEDLRQFLERRPLKYVKNPSKSERVSNWFHRNGILAGSSLMVCLFISGFLSLNAQVPFPDRAEFRRGMTLLNSSSEADWNEARQIFDRFHRDYPESAWPSLYLASTIDKFNQKTTTPDKKKTEDVNLLMKEVINKPDAEQALRNQLEKDPDSVRLMTNFAEVLLRAPLDEEAKKQKPQRDEEARKLLLRALDLQPDNITILSNLIKLERLALNHQRALELTSRIIATATKLDLGHDKIYKYRNIMLACHSKLIDQAIDGTSNSADHLQAAGHLDAIESTLKEMGQDQEKIRIGRGKYVHTYIVEVYLGCVASGRAVLAADSGDLKRATALFDQADRHFKNSLSVNVGELSAEEQYRKPVEMQTRLLNDRRERSLKSIKP
jgi:serine/threonine protein kinase